MQGRGCTLGAPSSWAPFVHPTWATPMPGVHVRVCVCVGQGRLMGTLGSGGTLLRFWGWCPGGEGEATVDRGGFVPETARGAGLRPDKEPSVSGGCAPSCRDREDAPPAAGTGSSPSRRLGLAPAPPPFRQWTWPQPGLPSPPGHSTRTWCRQLRPQGPATTPSHWPLLSAWGVLAHAQGHWPLWAILGLLRPGLGHTCGASALASGALTRPGSSRRPFRSAP